jgi:hypothetical protein
MLVAELFHKTVPLSPWQEIALIGYYKSIKGKTSKKEITIYGAKKAL